MQHGRVGFIGKITIKLSTDFENACKGLDSTERGASIYKDRLIIHFQRDGPSSLISHVADIFQPVAAVFVWQREADMPAFLPAPTDFTKLQSQAGQEEERPEHEEQDGEGGHQEERGREVIVILSWVESSAPSVQAGVEGAHEQGAVAER